MEDRVRDVEVKVAVIETQMEVMTSALKENTAAINGFNDTLNKFKGGSAVLIGAAMFIGSILTIVISWFKD
jgi:hypothetical protein